MNSLRFGTIRSNKQDEEERFGQPLVTEKATEDKPESPGKSVSQCTSYRKINQSYAKYFSNTVNPHPREHSHIT